jgi:competence protein ComEC
VINLNVFNPIKRVFFLDVYGDSTIIQDHFNQCNILIDTGTDDEFDTVLKTLRSMNIKHLDYMIISHNHLDHNGEFEDIINSLEVKQIVDSSTIDDYVNTTIKCGTIEMYFYNLDYNYVNENNNSVYLSLLFNNKHYLFTGDGEFIKEKEFMNSYQTDVDILKVPHHGSNTSSSQVFLESLQPESAVIMVHRQNHFGHPDSIVIDRYTDLGINLYRTDLLGSIEIQYIFGIERKKYYKP